MYSLYQRLHDAVDTIWGARPPANVVRDGFRQTRAGRSAAGESDDAAQ